MNIDKLLNPMPTQNVVASPQHPVPPHATPVLRPPVLRVPLPIDTDKNFSLPINVSGRPGLRIADCKCFSSITSHMTILDIVDDASRCVDHLIPPGSAPLVRAYFAGEMTASVQPHIKPCTRPVKTGLTVADLLTFMLCRQYRAWRDNFKIMNTVDAEYVVGRGVVPAGTAVAFENLYVVAIRRSDGKNGQVRWYPELEVRFE